MLTGGVDEVFSRTASDGSLSLLRDRLGGTIAGASGSAVDAEYTYAPFGATTITGNDLGSPSRFTGREDEGDGLYYYRARYYSATQQRFLSRDPIGLASGDTNPYAYVVNQPTGLNDPMGTKPRTRATAAASACRRRIRTAWSGSTRAPISATDGRRPKICGISFTWPAPPARAATS